MGCGASTPSELSSLSSIEKSHKTTELKQEVKNSATIDSKLTADDIVKFPETTQVPQTSESISEKIIENVLETQSSITQEGDLEPTVEVDEFGQELYVLL